MKKDTGIRVKYGVPYFIVSCYGNRHVIFNTKYE